MAGIGIELRKLFNESNGLFNNIKDLSFSVFVTVGSWLITVINLSVFNLIKNYYGAGDEIQVISLSTAAITYSFIFAQFILAPFHFIATRYVSDCIYLEKNDRIAGSYYGILRITTFLSVVVVLIYMYKSTLTDYYILTFVFLTTIITMLMVNMIYISLIKNFKMIMWSYAIGLIVSIMTMLLLFNYPEILIDITSPSYAEFVSYTLGMTTTCLIMTFYLLINIKGSYGSPISNFEFLKYIKKYYSLVIIGICYVVASWIHVFLNRIYGDNITSFGKVLKITPSYDIATFLVFLFTIPSIVYFFIFVETKFSKICNEFYMMINTSGNFNEMKAVSKDMREILFESMYNNMKLQFFISFILTILSKRMILFYKMDSYITEYMRYLVYAAYCTIFLSMFIVILLYLDAKVEALFVAVPYAIMAFLFSFIGRESSEGIAKGFVIASMLGLIIGDLVLENTLNNLVYRNFYKQNYILEGESKIIDKIIWAFNKNVLVIIAMACLLFLTGCASYDSRGFNSVTGRNWHTMSKYDKEQYDYQGFNAEGINREGYDRSGKLVVLPEGAIENEDGVTTEDEGYGPDGFNAEGYDREGYNKQGYSAEGYDKQGYNKQGFGEDGFDRNGFNKNGLDKDGYNRDGLDKNGIDREGYNKEGLNKAGYNRNGINKEGFNKNGIYVGEGE